MTKAVRVSRSVVRRALPLLTVIALSGSPGCSDVDCDLRIETDILPIGVVGEEYRTQLDSDCGGDSWFLEEGLLPPGIELREEGLLIGTPQRAGVFDFTVGVADVNGIDFDRFNDLAFKGMSLQVLDERPEA